ncbi:hypothetical protein BDF22DRAFT_702319 [Syncephalis plumigaleata]|nr:hypothetical protein BDF22DRAFT_702319 [Syncephalis plumigaleata]
MAFLFPRILVPLLVIISGIIAVIAAENEPLDTSNLSASCKQIINDKIKNMPCVLAVTEGSTSTLYQPAKHCPLYEDGGICPSNVTVTAFKELDTNCKDEITRNDKTVLKVYGFFINVDHSRQLCTKEDNGSYCSYKTANNTDRTESCKPCVIQGATNIVKKWNPPLSPLHDFTADYRKIRSKGSAVLTACNVDDKDLSSNSTTKSNPTTTTTTTNMSTSLGNNLFSTIIVVVVIAMIVVM